MQQKLKSYNFWVKLISAIILIARVVLAKFGYNLDSALVLDIATLVAGLFVVLGIINEPTGFDIKYENMDKRENKNMKFKEELQQEIQKLEQIYDDFKAGDLSSAEKCISKILDAIDGIADDLNAKEEEAQDEENVEGQTQDAQAEGNQVDCNQVDCKQVNGNQQDVDVNGNQQVKVDCNQPEDNQVNFEAVEEIIIGDDQTHGEACQNAGGEEMNNGEIREEDCSVCQELNTEAIQSQFSSNKGEQPEVVAEDNSCEACDEATQTPAGEVTAVEVQVGECEIAEKPAEASRLSEAEARHIEEVVDATEQIEKVAGENVTDEEAFAQMLLNDKVINALATKIIAKLGE